MSDVNISRLEVRNRPKGSPVSHQDWKELLFLHWKYDPKDIQKTLPPGLFVDTFEDSAYITIVPFFIENASVVNVPSFFGFSRFVEVNVRTYVYDEQGIPGVWFYSLDLNSSFGARLARETFHLPYHHSELKGEKRESGVLYKGHRVSDPSISMEFDFKGPHKPFHHSEVNSLDFFLVERYVLFAYSDRLQSARVHHTPYPLVRAENVNWKTNLLESHSFYRKTPPADLWHFSSGVNVDIFNLV